MLCSKCKGICNENSENVGRKRKVSESLPTPSKRSANAPVTRSANMEALNKRKLNNNVHNVDDNDEEVSTALTGNTNKINIESNSKKPLLTVSNLNTTLRSKSKIKEIEVHSTEHSDCSNDATDDLERNIKQSKVNGSKTKKVLRKKRCVDTCDEFGDNSEDSTNRNNTNNNSNCDTSNTCSNTRTIKISYGPQGEGTVLKIPAQIETLTHESEENVDMENTKLKTRDTHTKAARRALKKAKKEARRKFLLNTSPNYAGNNSPRYNLSGTSPRYVVDGVSSRHGLGNNSPRYVSATAYELNIPRRRKHKMKHKKKHREDRKHKEGDVR